MLPRSPRAPGRRPGIGPWRRRSVEDHSSGHLFVSELHRLRPVEGAAALAGQVEAHLTAVHGFESWSPQQGGRGAFRRCRFLAGIARMRRPADVVYMPDSGLTLRSIVRGLAIAAGVRPGEFTLLVTQFHLGRRTAWGLRVAARVPWHWIVSNPDQAETLGAYGIEARVLRPRIPASKVSSKERLAARAALGLPAEGDIFLHVGHATRGRNLRTLAPLATKGTLVLVLSDAFPEESDSLPDGENVVVVRGFVPDLCDYYRAADVYVFPTARAASVIGIPVSIVESLANGLPVVAVRSPMVEPWRGVPGVTLVDSADDIPSAALAAVGSPAGVVRILGLEACGDDFDICRRTAAG